MEPAAAATAPPRRPTLWRPARVVVTKSAFGLAHGASVVARCEAVGVSDIEVLKGDRLPSLIASTDRETYALAKRTLAVVISPPSKRRLQPIPPSADWRIDLAEGCPGHCQYCYLASSLSGPPITRVYANLPDILAEMDGHVGRGTVTSGSNPKSPRCCRRHGTQPVLDLAIPSAGDTSDDEARRHALDARGTPFLSRFDADHLLTHLFAFRWIGRAAFRAHPCSSYRSS